MIHAIRELLTEQGFTINPPHDDVGIYLGQPNPSLLIICIDDHLHLIKLDKHKELDHKITKLPLADPNLINNIINNYHNHP
jgi:hypothetical protein